METKHYAVAHGVLAERVGEDVVVVNLETGQSFRLTDAWAEAFIAVDRGYEGAELSVEILDGLVGNGLLSHTVQAPPSRRTVLAVSAASLGAGALAVALPGVAAASSEVSPPSGITLTGVWAWQDPGSGKQDLSFIVFGFDFPDLGDWPAGTSPSGLSIDGYGTQIPIEAWVSSSDADPSTGDFVSWYVVTVPAFFDSGRTLTGNFTWDGTFYPVTFTFDPGIFGT